MTELENGENFLFDLEKSQVASAYLQEKSKNEDGLYRPKLEQAKDKKNYYATIRILPNFRRDKTLGPTALEKHLHYADFKNNPELSGYYDCMKNFDDKCSLCDMYWSLKNTKDPRNEEKAKLISRSTKYYSYILIIEDENQPDLQGKIMIFPFGYKIKQMILDQFNHPKNPCRVEDLSNGREFLLHIKEVGGYANYDSSKFEDRCPIKIPNSKGVLTEVPLGADGKIDKKYQGKVMEFLLSREKDLEEFSAKKWTDDEATKVQKILAILSGQSIPTVSNVENAAKTTTASNLFSTVASEPAIEANDFFNEASNSLNTSSSTDSFFDDDLPF